MNRFQIFLSRRSTGILFTIISIFASNCWQQILPNFDVDNSFCIAAAKNISEGHGYSIEMADPGDLSKSYFQPLNKWPPGHSWLLFLIHKIFHTDWVNTTYILNALGLTILVLLFRKLLFQLEFPSWIVHCAILFFGFFEYTFHFSNNTDLLALVFYLAGLSVLLTFVKSTGNTGMMVLTAGFLLGSTAYMKYLYIPLAFLPFVSLLAYGQLTRQKIFLFAALKGLLSISLIIFSLLLFQYLNSGNSVYINPSKTGFFPEQLLWLGPVVPASFINLNFINMQLSIYSSIPYEKLNNFWSLINVICIGWLFFTAYKIFRDKISRRPDYRSFYAIHAVVFAICLFGFLSVLSVLKYKKYPDSFSLWVYVGEIRYYAVLTVLLTQFALLIFIHPEYFFKHTRRPVFQWILILILLEEVTHGIYFNSKQILVKKSYSLRQEHDAIFLKTKTFINRLSEKNEPIVFSSNAQEIANAAALEGIPVMYDPGTLRPPVPSSRSITLIIAVDKRVPGQDIPLLQGGTVRPDYEFKSVSYYIVNVPKSTGF